MKSPAYPIQGSLFLITLLLACGTWNLQSTAACPKSKGSDGRRRLTGPQETAVKTPDLLKPGQVVSQLINGGESQSFAISLAAGQYLSLHIEQHGSILLATLFDPRGGEVIQMDYSAGGHGPIYISAIARSSGNYRLEILAVNKWANSANFEVTLEELRAAEDADQPLIEAQKVFAEGRKSFKANKASVALEYYSRALSYWGAIKNSHWQALTQYARSEAYRNLGDRENCEKSLIETLKILDTQMASNDWRLKAAALNDLGSIYAATRPTEQALAPLNEALDIFAANSDRRGQASSLNNLAIAHGRAGDLSLSRELVERALTFRRAENDQGGANNLLNSLGAISDRLGESDRALEYFSQALRGWDQVDGASSTDRARVAAVLSNLATASDKVGNWNQALDYYDKALAKFGVADPNRAATLDNKGELYASLGDFKKAHESFDQALLLLAVPKPDRDIKAGLLVHMGQLSLIEGDPSAALSNFEQARDVGPNQPKLGDVLTNLGAAFALKGELEKALENYQKALDIQLRLKDRRGQALTLQKRGEAHALLGKQTEALKDFTDALGFWKAVKDRRGEAVTFNSIARIERDRGNIREALETSGEAIRIIESLRTGISSRQLRTSYFSIQENYYELDIDLKMQLSNTGRQGDYVAAAFESSEKTRARVLLDTLSEAGLDRAELRNAGASVAGLIEQRAHLRQRLGSKAQARTKLLNGAHSPVQIEAIDQEIDEVTEKYDQVEAQLRIQNPRLAALTKPQPSTLAQIQRQLDDHTLLLEYALGDKRSYVWAVTPDSVNGFELPARDQIEPVARRMTAALTARNREEKNESFTARQLRIEKSEKEYSEASAALSKMVLEPVAPLLGRKRLVVVADGALQMVPFAVLPSRGSMVEAQSAEPKRSLSDTGAARGPSRLIDEHEMISLPSASVLALQRRELANRQPAPLAVAVIADPVFDDQDVRVARTTGIGNQHRKETANTGPGSKVISPQVEKSSSSRLSSVNTALSSALRDVGMSEDGKLPRLALSRQEARAIARAVSPGQSFSALDFKASRETATSGALSKYRIIHFATHGVLDLEHPELSGIVLSMVDEKGQPQDGYLRLHEIYNLNLPAELVVLSACQTGIGKQVRGEGLIALTRGFMYAGAARVVASLWKVDDAATSELMAEFYKQMFTNKLKPAAALRAAQVKMSQQKRWQSPYYWAGFFLQGEWN